MSDLLAELAALYAQQGGDRMAAEKSWRDDFIRQHGSQADAYTGQPSFAGRFAGQLQHQKPTSPELPAILALLMRQGLPIGDRESSNVRDVTQSVGMNPLQAVRDLYQQQNALGRAMTWPR